MTGTAGGSDQATGNSSWASAGGIGRAQGTGNGIRVASAGSIGARAADMGSGDGTNGAGGGIRGTENGMAWGMAEAVAGDGRAEASSRVGGDSSEAGTGNRAAVGSKGTGMSSCIGYISHIVALKSSQLAGLARASLTAVQVSQDASSV